MQKKTKNKIFSGAIGSIVTGLFSFGLFSIYGGNKCDISYVSNPNNVNNLIQIGSCDCFCCKGFYGQGYESCGMFGLYLGLIIGAILGILIIHLIYKKR